MKKSRQRVEKERVVNEGERARIKNRISGWLRWLSFTYMLQRERETFNTMVMLCSVFGFFAVSVPLLFSWFNCLGYYFVAHWNAIVLLRCILLHRERASERERDWERVSCHDHCKRRRQENDCACGGNALPIAFDSFIFLNSLDGSFFIGFLFHCSLLLHGLVLRHPQRQ